MSLFRLLFRTAGLVVVLLLGLPGAQSVVVAQNEGTTVPAETRQGVAGPEAGTGLDGIGSTFAEFEAVYGEGEEIDPVDSLYEFPNAELDGATLVASFPEGIAGHIGFESEGGLPVDAISALVERVLPADAGLAESYALPEPSGDGPALRIEEYESDRLGDAADGRTSIMVGYQEPQTGPESDASAGTVVGRATVTIPTANGGQPGTPGDPGGIGLTEDAWEAVYGDGRASQGGVVYDNVTFPTPAFEIIARFDGPDATISSLQFEYDNDEAGGASREDVLAQQLDSLPGDAMFEGSYYLPPTPGDPIGIVVDHWESASLAGSTGQRGSIIVVTRQILASQDTGSPSELVVPRMDIVIAE